MSMQKTRKNEPPGCCLEDEIKRLEKEFDMQSARERQRYRRKIIDKRKDLLELSEYTLGITDGTAEGIEESAVKQHGRFSIVSDEAEAVRRCVWALQQRRGKPGVCAEGF